MNRAALAVALVLFAFGCRSVPRDVDPLAGSLLAADDPRPEALLAGLAESAGQRQSATSMVRFAIDAPDLQFRGSMRIAGRRPGFLRIEILGLFGQIAAVLATNGRTFQYLNPGSGEQDWGGVTDGLLWEVARIDLSPVEAVTFLLGATQASRALRISGAEIREDGSIRVALADSRGQLRQRLDFDPEGRLRRLEEWDALAQPLRESTYDAYRDVEGAPLAHKVEIRFRRAEGSAVFHFQAVELNPDLADEVFAIELPKPASPAPGGAQG